MSATGDQLNEISLKIVHDFSLDSRAFLKVLPREFRFGILICYKRRLYRTIIVRSGYYPSRLSQEIKDDIFSCGCLYNGLGPNSDDSHEAEALLRI
ncbi:MAG: hypothetical protein DWI22_19975 [Planctomycetota bacterium]|nr:MAG: hypothetical protein DWI22_19975 [Planctomycetota bacterium]